MSRPASKSHGETLPLLDGTVDLDVDDVTDAANLLSDFFFSRKFFDFVFSSVPVLAKVGRRPDEALLAEVTREGVLQAVSRLSGNNLFLLSSKSHLHECPSEDRESDPFCRCWGLRRRRCRRKGIRMMGVVQFEQRQQTKTKIWRQCAPSVRSVPSADNLPTGAQGRSRGTDFRARFFAQAKGGPETRSFCPIRNFGLQVEFS